MKKISEKKQTVTIHVFEEDCNYGIPETPKEFMAFWQEKIDLVPAEFADTAKISVEANPFYDSANLDIDVYYRRLETDIEEQTRLAKEKARREYVEEQELCKLEELKKKYNV